MFCHYLDLEFVSEWGQGRREWGRSGNKEGKQGGVGEMWISVD